MMRVSMDLLSTIIALIFLPTSIVAGIVFVMRKFFEQGLNRDLESFKAKCSIEIEQSKAQFEADLKTRLFEFETKFSSFHQKQTEIIRELYSLLVDAEFAVIDLVHPMQPSPNERTPEIMQFAEEKCVELYRFFSKHTIYLDPSVCDDVEKVMQALRMAIAKFQTSRLGVYGNQDMQMWFDAWEVMIKEIPPTKKALESHFRKTFASTPEERLLKPNVS